MLHPSCSAGDDLPDLIRRCADGDDRAWDEFIDTFHRRILLYAVRVSRLLGLRPGGTADGRGDLVQDVYVRLLSHDRRALRVWRGESEQSFSNYLATIVHAVACDSLKRRRSLKRAALMVSLDAASDDDGFSLAERLAAPDSDSPERVLLEHLAPSRLLEALDKAERGPQGSRNRLIFQLYVLEGFTASEISNLPGLTMSTANVESAIRRTRERLRFVLGDHRTL